MFSYFVAVIEENNNVVEKPKPKPSVECAMCNDVESNELFDCDCMAPLYWNGTKCIEKNKCPCVENHIRFVKVDKLFWECLIDVVLFSVRCWIVVMMVCC